MSVISMKQLLEAGVHFGHQTRRWNPKMAPYIYTERNGIYIIDLQKSVGMVDEAYDAIRDCVANGGKILFVGTKKQAYAGAWPFFSLCYWSVSVGLSTDTSRNRRKKPWKNSVRCNKK